MPRDTNWDFPTDQQLSLAGVFRAVVVYCSSTLLVVAGVWFGYDFIPRENHFHFPHYAVSQPPRSFVGAFANWDGVWYRDIVEHGYQYDPSEGSYVVFFPGYPLLGYIVAAVTRSADAVLALLLVSNFAFFACLLLLPLYIKSRFPVVTDDTGQWAQLLLAFSPLSFFFRMAYSESLFVLLILLVLIGVQRRWSPWIVGLCVGASTGVRLAGVALVPIFLFYVWQRSDHAAATGDSRTTPWSSAHRWPVLFLAPLSIWGLLGYMVYLGWAFDDPLAFHHNQARFNDILRAETSVCTF